MPEGTKGWTEMKTGDNESVGQKLLSGQGPCLRSEGWEGGEGSQGCCQAATGCEEPKP